MTNETAKKIVAERPPVVVIMGHIDHGKSTLLDFIRKSNITDGESGGITQHIGAYEVEHETPDGVKKITFLDTPGHEAFKGMRSRGASVADLAILIVSAEDGVKPQTLEAYQAIKQSKMPFIVAINKIDSPKANIQQTQSSLIENEIYLEGLGGDIPYVEISAKTGQNIDDLLSLILLVVELEELQGDTSKNAEGIVIEAHKDTKKGISATLIIKNGTLKVGQFVACETAMSPVRLIEDCNKNKLESATFSSPIIISGWNELPESGQIVMSFDSKKEAEEYCKDCFEKKKKEENSTIKIGGDTDVNIPVILKTDVTGSAEAIVHELKKLELNNVSFHIIETGTGSVTEADAKRANSHEGSIIIGFNVGIDNQAEAIKERESLNIQMFSIIYDVSNYLKQIAEERRPRVEIEEIIGEAKVLKTFNKTKHSQVLGGKVKSGSLKVGNKVKILRRNEEIGYGIIKGLQQQKAEAQEVKEGNEFGCAIETKTEIAEHDHIQAFEKSIK